MGGILRITKAEFIKIFKKPSVYIMGILLAIVITISLFTFSPTNSYSFAVSIPGANVSEMQTEWLGNYRSDAKDNLDVNFDNAQEEINFYTNLNLRSKRVNTALEGFFTAQKSLKNSISSGETSQEINYYYNIVKTKLSDLITAYTNNYNLETYDFYSTYLTSDVYLSHYNEFGTLGNLNVLSNKSLTETATSFNTYYVTNQYEQELLTIKNNYIISVLNNYISKVTATFNAYNNLVVTSSTFSYDLNMEIYRGQLKDHLSNFKAYVDMLSSNSREIILLNEDNLNAINTNVDKVINALDSINDNSTDTLYDRHKSVVRKVAELNVVPSLSAFVNELKFTSIPLEVLTTLNEFITVNVDEIKNNILTDIADYVLENGSSTTLAKKAGLNELFTNYKTLSLNAKTYVSNVLMNNYLNGYSQSEILEIKGFKDYNSYKINEQIVKISFLIENGTFNHEYANVFAFNQNSGNQTSVFDFMFYALKISSLIIIIFAIIMASNIMAYEFDTGTIKLLAIRPFKRHKILLAKLLAVMFFVIIFVLFSALISLMAGFSSFSFELTPILAVFNASVAFTIHPIILILINIVTIILEILFYAVIALSISTIFRSFAAAMSTSVITLLLALVSNIIFGGILWYSYVPFMNTDLFRYLGGVFNSTAGQTGFAGLLNNGLLSNSNFYMSVIIYVGFTLFVLFASYSVFKKRDI